VTETEAININPCSGSGKQFEIDATRRRLLQAGAAAVIGLLPNGTRAESDDPKRMMRPQPGDLLVRSEGDQEGAVISATDVKMGDPPIIAWAMDPATKLPRDGSRLNQVVLLRLDPSTLDADTKPHAADGLVAYSAICTHAQCTVTGWIEDKKLLHCPCHQSEYDPQQDAKVVAGPAPRPLAALPLKIADGKPAVAERFIGKVGMDQPSM
jgi:rieske iron-sulfur protein